MAILRRLNLRNRLAKCFTWNDNDNGRMTNAQIQFVTTGAPGGDTYCFTAFPRLFLDIAASLSGYLPGTYSTFVLSQTEPVATDRDKIWIQLGADNLPTGRFFTYVGGWFMRHPRRDSGSIYMGERLWWVGTESDAWSLDGGSGQDPSGTPPTLTTGAMWEKDSDFDFRFPLAAGTSPKPTTVSIGATGGEEEHALIVSEIPPHVHTFPIYNGDGANNSTDRINTTDELVVANPTFPTSSVGGTGTPAVVVAHNNLPPYRVGIWLKPTIRQFFSP